jgi:UrcA family protein
VKNMTINSTLAGVALIAVMALAGAATAEPASADPDIVQVRVWIGDLDLHSTAGAVSALGRIEMAARSICGEAPSPVDLTGRAQHRACTEAAIDNGVTTLGAPTVTALRQGRSSEALASR